MTATVVETELPASRGDRGIRRVQLAITGLVVIVVGFVAWSTGAYRLPHVDDWAYLRMQDTLDHTGRIVGVGWNDVSLIGQLEVVRVVDWLLNDFVLASRLVVIASGVACAALVWFLIGRTNRRDLRPLALLSFVVFPGVTVNWVTSMTDLPATALMLGCLAAGLAAPVGLGRDRVMRSGPVLAAVALGVAAITVRQLAVTAPLAVIGMLILTPQRPSSRRKVLALGAIGAVTALAFLWWRAGIDKSAPDGAFAFVTSTSAIIRNFSILGLGLAPMVIATGGLSRWSALRRDPGYSSATRSFVTAAPIVWTLFAAIVGQEHSYVSGSLIGSVTFDGATGGLVGIAFWIFALASAVAGGAVVAVAVTSLASAMRGSTWRGALSRSLERPELSMPLMFALTSFGVACASSYLQQSFYERYLFPGFVAVMMLLCSRPLSTSEVSTAEASPSTAEASPSTAEAVRAPREQHRRYVAATVVAAALALVAVLAATDGYALQEARWKGAALAVARGADPETIDAGFEYVGAHYPGSAEPGSLDVNGSYLAAFVGFRRCVVANPVVSAPAGSSEIGEIEYRGGLGLVRRVVPVFATPC